MATWADLEALGYTVSESAPGVLYVSGNGLSTYIAASDQQQIDSLADPTLHAERIATPQLAVADATATFTAPVIAPLDPKTASLADVIAVVNELTA